MRKSEALKRLNQLHQRFESDFAPEYLNSHEARERWLSEAGHLAVDIFGLDDPLLRSVQPLSLLSEEFERRTISLENRRRKGEEWYSKTSLWFNRLSWNIANTSRLVGSARLEKHPIVSRTVWLAISVGLMFITYFATVSYEDYKANNSRRDQGRRAGAEFQSWIASVPYRQSQSYSSLMAVLDEQNLTARDAAYWRAVRSWMERQRLEMDATRALYMVRIASLGGDTTKYDPPKRVTVRPKDAPQSFGLDTL